MILKVKEVHSHSQVEVQLDQMVILSSFQLNYSILNLRDDIR